MKKTTILTGILFFALTSTQATAWPLKDRYSISPAAGWIQAKQQVQRLSKLLHSVLGDDTKGENIHRIPDKRGVYLPSLDPDRSSKVSNRSERSNELNSRGLPADGGPLRPQFQSSLKMKTCPR